MSDSYILGKYDVVVVGAGHAGCEASLAAARMGKKTAVISINLESIAMMACNPSIGGTGKGHLVREIDALGGEMGINIDKSSIQTRMLNTSKGPAVHSLRAQADKNLYHLEMKKTLENQENLDLKQAEVVELVVEDGRVKGVVTKSGGVYLARAVILCTGTFLRGKVFIGSSCQESGPNGLAPAKELSSNLENHGFELRRFKTGTPARAMSSSFDYTQMDEQPGDPTAGPFSFLNSENKGPQISCWLTFTNQETHRVIRENFHRSALFSGKIEGVGPRYCPSIEDKVNRFADKERHQLFIEPEGMNTEEMYIQGMSSSLPEDVQIEFYRTIPGLKNLNIVRPAYAIEYDCIDPQTLKTNLEYKDIANLFCAGQFNGSSGYEEAAAQGLMAGINASLKLDQKKPLVLSRSEAYIGVLMDDLILKGTEEPYRIMTSRAEYRLLLRQDNADLRLTEKGREVSLVSDERYQVFQEKRRKIEELTEYLEEKVVQPKDINFRLSSLNMSNLNKGQSLLSLLKRKEITYQTLVEWGLADGSIPGHIVNQVEIQIKYKGYIDKQIKQVEKFKKTEIMKIPGDLDYEKVEGLRIEAAQKLGYTRPESIGQASRISGVSPADIGVLMVYMEKERRKKIVE